MRPFSRAPSAQATRAIYVPEIIELAAALFTAGLAHLLIGVVGHHADGWAVLFISAAALLTGAIVHRWWGTRRHLHTTGLDQRPSTLRDLLSVPVADRELLRLRTTLPDRPGRLAALSRQLAALDVNILAIQVHPCARGVVDELLVAAPRGVSVDDVTAAVAAGGGTLIHTGRADAHDLVDPPTRALTLATHVAQDGRLLNRALLSLLSAESVTDQPQIPGASTIAELRGPAGQPLFLSRPTMPFTPIELSRAQAMIDLCAATSTAPGKGRL